MYDLIVIGAGPGGYVAAERAAAEGQKVLLVEKEHLGGVCTNWGCIPTKTLLNSAKLYKHGKEAEAFGVNFENATFDLKAAMKWKQEVIETMRNGIAFQMKRHKVEVISGEAKLAPDNSVSVAGTRYQGKNIIIATGSSPVVPPIPGADGNEVVTSTEILEIDKLPKSLAVIGGGVIGVEFASFFSSLDVEVHVIEMMPEIIPFMDNELAKILRRSMKGVAFHLDSRVTSIDKGTVTFSVKDKEEKVKADMVLMAVGRKPNIAGLDAETVGLDVGKKGIKVNEKMQTNLPGVYAIGDVTGESLLAHSASRMGEVAVNTILGKRDLMRYHAVPWALYSLPEAAGCGLTEEQAKAEGIQVKTGKWQMRANGRFFAEHGKENGLCKVIVDAETEAILGVHMLGGICSEMIFGAAMAIEAELRVQELKEIIFPHPTVSEVIKDALWEIQ